MFDDFGLATPAVPGFWPEGDAVWQSFHDELVSQGVSEQTIKTVWEQTNKGTTQISDQDLMSVLAANASKQDSAAANNLGLDTMIGQGNANTLFGDSQTQSGSALSFDDSGSAPFVPFDASLPQSPVDFRTLMPADVQKGSESLPGLQEFWQEYGELGFPFELPSEEEKAALVECEAQLEQLEAIYASIPEHVAGIPLTRLRTAVWTYKESHKAQVVALRTWHDWLAEIIAKYGWLVVAAVAQKEWQDYLRRTNYKDFFAIQQALSNIHLNFGNFGNSQAGQQDTSSQAAPSESPLSKDDSILYTSWIGEINKDRIRRGLEPYPPGTAGHHEIPQKIRKYPDRYPGWGGFGWNELPNLRPISGQHPNPNNPRGISDHDLVTNWWDDWYAEHPTATRDEVEAAAREVGRIFADRFLDRDENEGEDENENQPGDQNNENGGFEA